MNNQNEFRTEHDTMGEMRVPASALYGAQRNALSKISPLAAFASRAHLFGPWG